MTAPRSLTTFHAALRALAAYTGLASAACTTDTVVNTGGRIYTTGPASVGVFCGQRRRGGRVTRLHSIPGSPKIDAGSLLFHRQHKMPLTIIGFQLFWRDAKSTPESLLYQTHILYDTWEAALTAAKEMAAQKANEYCEILNKVDNISFSDCLQFKNTNLYILVDAREPNEQFGSVQVCPVFSETTPKN
jgi:hypothetical protein